MSEEENFIQTFLKVNFPIIALIGIFAALAKFFIGDGTDPNAIFLSILVSILTAFLLIIFVLFGIIQIIKRTRFQISHGFISFLRSSISDIILSIIIILIGLITVAMIFIIKNQYPVELRLGLLSVELLLGLVVSAIFVTYIIVKVNVKIHLFFICLLCVVIMFIFNLFFGLSQNPVPSLDLFSAYSHLMWILMIIEVVFSISGLKLVYYIFREI